MTAAASGLCYVPLMAVLVGMDQLTKHLCMEHIDYGTLGIEVLPCFNLVHVYNHGAAFSMLSEMGGWQRWLFVAIALVICTVFAVMLARTPRTQRVLCLSYALFISGAAGNLIDRLQLGYVVDFLLFYCRHEDGVWAYPAFNVADMAVSSGAALMVWEAFFMRGRERAGTGDGGRGGRGRA